MIQTYKMKKNFLLFFYFLVPFSSLICQINHSESKETKVFFDSLSINKFNGEQSSFLEIFKIDSNSRTLIKINDTFYDEPKTAADMVLSLISQGLKVKKFEVINDLDKISESYKSKVPFQRYIIFKF